MSERITMEVNSQVKELDIWHSSPFLHLIAGVGKLATFRARLPEVLSNTVAQYESEVLRRGIEAAPAPSSPSIASTTVSLNGAR